MLLMEGSLRLVQDIQSDLGLPGGRSASHEQHGEFSYSHPKPSFLWDSPEKVQAPRLLIQFPETVVIAPRAAGAPSTASIATPPTRGSPSRSPSQLAFLLV